MKSPRKEVYEKARQQERETRLVHLFILQPRYMNRSNHGTPVKKTIFDFFKSPKKRRMYRPQLTLAATPSKSQSPSVKCTQYHCIIELASSSLPSSQPSSLSNQSGLKSPEQTDTNIGKRVRVFWENVMMDSVAYS